MHQILIQPDGENDSGPCACCGNKSRTVWGYIHTEDGEMSLYYVHWTVNGVAKHGANFDFVLGKWGADAHPRERVAVSLAYRLFEGKSQFMLIDASKRPISRGDIAAKGFTREEVVDTPLAQFVFHCVDTLLAQDIRLKELTTPS